MKRLLKIACVLWLVGEWYTRAGRDLLFGPEGPPQPRRGPDTITVLVPLPRGWGWQEALSLLGEPIPNRRGIEVGAFLAPKVENGIWRINAVFDRAMLGWPINVAVSEAEHYTLRRLNALGRAS